MYPEGYSFFRTAAVCASVFGDDTRGEPVDYLLPPGGIIDQRFGKIRCTGIGSAGCIASYARIRNHCQVVHPLTADDCIWIPYRKHCALTVANDSVSQAETDLRYRIHPCICGYGCEVTGAIYPRGDCVGYVMSQSIGVAQCLIDCRQQARLIG